MTNGPRGCGPSPLSPVTATAMAGQCSADFGLAPDAKVKDEIARAWAASQSYYRASQ
jgi:hypothetical protein